MGRSGGTFKDACQQDCPAEADCIRQHWPDPDQQGSQLQAQGCNDNVLDFLNAKRDTHVYWRIRIPIPNAGLLNVDAVSTAALIKEGKRKSFC